MPNNECTGFTGRNRDRDKKLIWYEHILFFPPFCNETDIGPWRPLAAIGGPWQAVQIGTIEKSRIVHRLINWTWACAVNSASAEHCDYTTGSHARASDSVAPAPDNRYAAFRNEEDNLTESRKSVSSRSTSASHDDDSESEDIADQSHIPIEIVVSPPYSSDTESDDDVFEPEKESDFQPAVSPRTKQNIEKSIQRFEEFHFSA